MSRRLLTPLVVLATFLGTGCVTVDWTTEFVGREIPESVTEELPPAGVDLTRCLELLGAPNFVQENRVHGLVLIYAWRRDRGRGLSVSVPIGDFSPSVSYSDAFLRGKGIVLWFDRDYVLTDWRRGTLAEILSSKQPPPSSIEDIERT